MSAYRDLQAAGRLANMSAPPRSVVELRPLRECGRAPGTGRGRQPVAAAPASGPSARLFARVCLAGLLEDGEARMPRGRDIARGIDPDETPDLVDTIAVLRIGAFAPWYDAVSATPTPLMRMRQAIEAMTLQARHGELLDRLAALGEQDLPPLLFARSLDVAVEAPTGPRPLQAMRLLAGTAGGLFVRARRPGAGAFLTGAPGARDVACQFDYWLPAGLRP